MQKIIGLDLGTNSIGWAIREINSSENQIVDKGVLTFEKGVATTKSGEEPAVKKRTECRSKRRNYQAKKYRKWELLKTLIQSEPSMCPLTIEELDGWRKYEKGKERVYPTNTEFINWLKLDFNGDGIVDFENPYQLRNGVAEKKFDNPFIIGRVLYHLVQRRGFRGRDEEESKTIMEGQKEKGIVITPGADEIHKIMEEQNTTLGTALYLDAKNNGKRIRKRYNLRTDFEEEFKTICKVQGIDGEGELFKNIKRAIIWQRPLRTQKGNVGRCTLEPSKPRCPISHPLYEEYRAWCFINNIKAKKLEQPESKFELLNEEQRQNIYKKLFFRKSKPNFEFSEIIKLLDPKRNTYRFNYNPNTTVTGCPVTAGLKDIFNCELSEIKIEHAPNNKRKNKKNYYDYIDIWHLLFSFDSKEKLTAFAKEQLKLDEEQTKKLLSIRMQQGYASLSLNAINKILPYLHQGFIYSEAVYLANLPKVLGQELLNDEINRIVDGIREQMRLLKKEKDEINIVNSLISDYLNLPFEQKHRNYPSYKLLQSDRKSIYEKLADHYGNKTWEELEVEEKNIIIASVEEKFQQFMQLPITGNKKLLFLKAPRLDERIKSYLKNEWSAKEDNLKYLYHPSDIEINPRAKEKDGMKILGEPIPISRGFKNPMAMKTLHHLKRLINYLIEREKIDEDTRIVVEIARELNDANRRKAIEKWQGNREKQNKEFAEAIKEISEKNALNIDPSKDEIIDKYRLWVEQDHQCIYTGKVINCTDLFDGTKFDLEHTVPADISFDNELKNLTVADSTYNRQIKQKHIPTELPNYENEVTIDGITYAAIKPRLIFMEEKVTHFEDQIEFWKKQSKQASTKDRKDHCIQQRHYNQFELDYWKKKLDTFTIKEYKAVWRNSQLRDTQLITKYALPYLKTVFEKVEVQKGVITSEFRKIFNVGFKKDRNKHTHHAIDAAILTLIPPAALRDKLLKEHFEAMEKQIRFHSYPSDWKYFNPEFIRNIEEETLVNYIKQDRTLVPAIKYVRKRGRIKYVKEKLLNGKWQYKLDSEGKKIPLIAKGDSIRGQLHEESFLGAIKEFEKDESGKPILETGMPVYKKDKDGSDKLTFVKRILLKDFTSIDDFEKIIDKTVRELITNTIQQRIHSGKSFNEAIHEEIWMVDKYGNPKKTDKRDNKLAPIRHVRCKVTAGRGYLSKEKALEIKEHAMPSKHEHKQFVYAKNDEMALCLYYEGLVNEKIERAFRFIGLFELAKNKFKQLSDINQNPELQFCEVGRGKYKTLIPLTYLITSGMRVLIFKDTLDEIRELNNKEMLKRLYLVYKFNEAPSPYIYLQYHAEARPDNELGVGETQIDLEKYQPRLKLVANNFNCLIEEKNFSITLDGKIILK